MPNDRPPDELESDFAALAGTAVAGGSPATAVTTLLHIGDEHLVVLSGSGATPATVRRIELGAARIARDFLLHGPPTSLEIERAIDFVEDEIMRLGTPADVDTTLWGSGLNLRPWAAVSGQTMPVDIVEQWFQRLASASLGQTGALQGMPTGREAAATLLILREFMHHRGYAAITVVDAVRAQD
jgi:exopolyphosphatase/pppGpp-phosphohydrolase